MGFFILGISSVWLERLIWVQEVVGSNPTFPTTILLCRREIKKEVKIIKYISKNEIEKLLSEGVIRNTRRGYVDRRGEHIGYYKTCGGKRYIEDKYVK